MENQHYPIAIRCINDLWKIYLPSDICEHDYIFNRDCNQEQSGYCKWCKLCLKSINFYKTNIDKVEIDNINKRSYNNKYQLYQVLEEIDGNAIDNSVFINTAKLSEITKDKCKEMLKWVI